MANSPVISQKKRFSVKIFSLALLLGLTFFSGYTGMTSIRYQEPVQTAWQSAINHKISKRVIAYKKATASLYQPNKTNNGEVHKISPVIYSHLTHIKLITARTMFNAASAARRFASIQLVTADAEEDALHFIAV